jgi:hypothetical protein
LIDQHKLREYGKLLGLAEKERFLDPKGHQEFYDHEINWTESESISRGVGLNVAHFDLSYKKLIGLKLSSNLAVIEHLNSISGGHGFESISEDYFIEPSPIFIMQGDDLSPQTLIYAGQIIERLWLQLTAIGIDMHPMPAIPFMCAHLFGESELNQLTKKNLQAIKNASNELISAQKKTSIMACRIVQNPNYLHKSSRKQTNET